MVSSSDFGAFEFGNFKIKVDMLEFKTINATVIGLGVSGLSAVKLLKKLGAKVRISDNDYNELIERRIKTLKAIGVDDIEVGKHTKKFIKGSNLIVVSPGVDEENKLFKEAKRKSIPIISEIELGYLNCRAPVIAITGTNGKTTTCCLVAHVLKKAKHNPILCGNVGRPFCDVALSAKANNIIVLEVSSFQLTYIDTFRPKVSMILNADLDHLDYHRTLKKYFKAKAQIFKNQIEGDFCILREEDFKNIFSKYRTDSKIMLISSKDKVDIYIDEKGYIVRRLNKKRERLIHTSKINIDGAKSVENILFVIALSLIYKIKKKVIFGVINEFKGLEHRIETVGIFEGVKYVDDSKATNVAATRLALNNLNEPVILIAGGQDKNTDFSHINFDFLKNVKEVILFGEAKQRLARILRKIKPISIVENLQVAVKLSKLKAKKGDYVLLSPMCASFDMFDSYKHRGKVFKELVKRINA